jgi:hypothetical protein
MKPKNIILILVLIGLIGFAIYLKINQKQATFSKPLSDFAISDTASIDKIFMADRSGRKVTLTRDANNQWKVNEDFPAFKERVVLLLMTMKRVSVKNSVGKKAKDYYIKEMATGALKVEIFSKGEKIKTYYVGGATPDNLGTVMMMENSSEPFVTHIEGFNGFLSTRYFTEEIEWRQRVVSNVNPETITKVKIEYPLQPEQGFELSSNDNTFYFSHIGEEAKIKANPIKAKEVLTGAAHLDFDDFVKIKPGLNQDSILASKPVCVISIETSKGDKIPTVKLYYKLAEGGTKQIINNNLDGELFYGTLSTRPKELIYIQQFAFKKVIHNYEYFK